MTRGVRLYLVGSFVLVSLAGCGRGFFQSAEREPWRAEAEIACLKSGAVKETPELVRISPISGPGVCGAEFPLKVAALGESSGSFGFADDVPRPPGAIGDCAALADLAAAAIALSGIALSGTARCRQPGYGAGAQRPDFADRARRRRAGGRRNRPAARGHARVSPPQAAGRTSAQPIRRAIAIRALSQRPPRASHGSPPRLGPAQGNPSLRSGRSR